jgi:WD40 repeat protein
MGIADILPITMDNAARVKLLRTLEDFQGRVWTLAFSADGIYFASADRDSLDIWDASSGQQLFGLGIQEIDLNGFAFSPDSRLVACPWTMRRDGMGRHGMH